MSWRWLLLLGLVSVPFAACGPDQRPDGLCNGPSFNLIVRAQQGPLPEDTRINVRYGGNQEGEPYELGKPRAAQAVSCKEDLTEGGASSTDPQGAAGDAGGSAVDTLVDGAEGVAALRCSLYTQGPARLDVTATGYEPIEDQALSFDRKARCEVLVEVKLKALLDAGL